MELSLKGEEDSMAAEGGGERWSPVAGTHCEKRDVVGTRLGVRPWRACWVLKCDLVSRGEPRKFTGRGVTPCDLWEDSWLGGGWRHWLLEAEGPVLAAVQAS